MKVVEINSLVLAYLGDTIYENYVRRALIHQGFSHVDQLQKEAVKYVSAKSQAAYLQKMMDVDFLSKEELEIVKRARNYKTTSHPKSCDIITYKKATGLEAVIGYFKLTGQEEKINKLIEIIVEV